jgi:DNA gyrase subunit A
VREFDERQLVMATEKGIVKKTTLSEYGHPRKGGIIAINLDKGDNVMGVLLTRGDEEIILASKNGKAIRFKEAEVRSMGRTAHGVGGMTLERGDVVVGMVSADDNETLLTICESGFGKRTKMDEYRTTGRKGKGIINIQTSARNGHVVVVLDVRDEDEVMIMTQEGMIIRTPVKGIRALSRNTQGVTLIKLNDGDRVTAVAKVVEKDGEEGPEGPEEPEAEEHSADDIEEIQGPE